MEILKENIISVRAINSAQRAIRKFKRAVNRKNYNKLYRLVNLRWKNENKRLPYTAQIALIFKDYLAEISNIEIKILKIHSEYMFDIMFEIEIVGKITKKYTLRFIKEIIPYKLSKLGKFRYDPKSLKNIDEM